MATGNSKAVTVADNLQPSSLFGATTRLPVDAGSARLRGFRWDATLATTQVSWDVASVQARALLDRTLARFRADAADAHDAMHDLLSGLWSIKSALDPEAWRALGVECVTHPVREALLEDPLIARSYNKPRGYAGDALLLDYIYTGDCHGIVPGLAVTELGERIFHFSRDTPACRAVRTRRDIIANAIDQTCDDRVAGRRPDILSVACGHLREASEARSVRANRVGRYVGLDQDPQSLALVDRQLGEHGVVTVCDSVKALFRGTLAAERFDLVYSTGLYDYLDDRLAARLTRRLFDMLNPGGRLIVANFLPNIWGGGIMETFMAWNLIYRTPQQVEDFASLIPASELAVTRTFTEPNENIVFLDLIKA